MTRNDAIDAVDHLLDTFVNYYIFPFELRVDDFFREDEGTGEVELGYCCWGDISYKYQPENSTTYYIENGTFALSDSTTVEGSIIINSPHFVVKLGELTQPVTSPPSFSADSGNSFRYSWFFGSYSYTNSSGTTTYSSTPFDISLDGGISYTRSASRLRYTSQQNYASTITYNYNFPYNSQWFWTGVQFYSSSFTPNAINLNLPSSISYNTLADSAVNYYNTQLDPDEEPITTTDITPYSDLRAPYTTTTIPDIDNMYIPNLQTVAIPEYDFSLPDVSDVDNGTILSLFVDLSNSFYNNFLSLPEFSVFLWLIVFLFVIRILIGGGKK